MIELTGLQKLCKMYGRVFCEGKHWVWDYVREKAVPEAEMESDPTRFRANEAAKFRSQHRAKR